MAQLLLFPDPRPLVERLGIDFFRYAPETPGVYLMRDHSNTVLYVGKAKNLRRRLASYRVANPERLRRRHLRLLRAVDRIELRPCVDEAAALENESTLLRTLRPAFNRAGTWPGAARYLAWRFQNLELELAVTSLADPRWNNCGPLGAGAAALRALLARVIWSAVHSHAGVAGLPQGWFAGNDQPVFSISCGNCGASCAACLEELFAGQPEPFCAWVLERTSSWTHPFDLATRAIDLEEVTDFAKRRQRG